MSSGRLHILTLLAQQRINVAEAERLLVLVAGRNWSIMLALWTAVVCILAPAAGSLAHLGHNFHTAVDSMLHTITASETFHCLRIFIRRFLGELP
jgi:hypothetical protein